MLTSAFDANVRTRGGGDKLTRHALNCCTTAYPRIGAACPSRPPGYETALLAVCSHFWPLVMELCAPPTGQGSRTRTTRPRGHDLAASIFAWTSCSRPLLANSARFTSGLISRSGRTLQTRQRLKTLMVWRYATDGSLWYQGRARRTHGLSRGRCSDR
jgi:hypothetical protein